MGLQPVIVEKDFWVCWTLKQLFSIPELESWLTFKGGTSLSKCFGLIQRFSEDIDIAVDFEKLGFTGDKDPRHDDLSHTQRRKLLDKMMGTCQDYIAGSFLKVLNTHISEVLGKGGWVLEVSKGDPNAVEFEYPAALDAKLDYIRPRVVLELGTHAEPIPQEVRPIRPYVADEFPQVFSEADTPVKVVVAKRTFWEKATILHAEYHRPADSLMPQRYSRHYADVAVMATTFVKEESLADLELLKKVCVHKDRFYHSGWARYLEATPGDFRMLPPGERLSGLRRDYQAMQVMFFGEAPSFDDIMNRLARLEEEINQ